MHTNMVLWRGSGYYYYPHYTDEETQVQRRRVTGRRSHSQLILELGCAIWRLGSNAWALSTMPCSHNHIFYSWCYLSCPPFEEYPITSADSRPAIQLPDIHGVLGVVISSTPGNLSQKGFHPRHPQAPTFPSVHPSLRVSSLVGWGQEKFMMHLESGEHIEHEGCEGRKGKKA